jgi:hypothetical protein
MTRYPSQHRRIHRACLSPHHRQLRQAALLLDLQDVLDERPRNGSVIAGGIELRRKP